MTFLSPPSLSTTHSLHTLLHPQTIFTKQSRTQPPNTSSFLHTLLHPQTLYLPSNHELNPQTPPLFCIPYSIHKLLYLPSNHELNPEHLPFSDYFGFYEAFQTIGTPTHLSYYHPSPTIPGQPQCHYYISLAPLHYFSLTFTNQSYKIPCGYLTFLIPCHNIHHETQCFGHSPCPSPVVTGNVEQEECSSCCTAVVHYH